MPVIANPSGSRVPDTSIVTSHSLTIYAGSTNSPIGLISSWAPQMTRDVAPVYEINAQTSGLPYENVPGNVKGLTISVTRYDIWVKKMEEAFGTTDLTMLSDQTTPFKVIEKWENKAGNSGESFQYVYEGCWFTSIGRGLRSDDARIVQVNAALVYLRKIKLPITTP